MHTLSERSTQMSDLSADVTIRPATRGDLARIVELQVQLGEHHRELEPDNPRYQIDPEQWASLIREAFDSASSAFLVATRDDQVCGFVRFSIIDKPWGAGCEMDTLVVDRGARGAGVGQQLVEHA